MIVAASVLFVLPVIVLFFLAQRAFIEGVTLTGTKGTNLLALDRLALRRTQPDVADALPVRVPGRLIGCEVVERVAVQRHLGRAVRSLVPSGDASIPSALGSPSTVSAGHVAAQSS